MKKRWNSILYAPDGGASGEPAVTEPAAQTPATEEKPAVTEPAAQTPATEEKPAVTEPAAKTPAAEEKPTVTGPAAPEKADDKAALEKLAALTSRTMSADIKAAALTRGIAPERVAYFERLVDKAALDIDAEDYAAKLAAAVDKIATDVPEMLGGVGTGGKGNFARNPGTAKDPFEQGLSGK